MSTVSNYNNAAIPRPYTNSVSITVSRFVYFSIQANETSEIQLLPPTQIDPATDYVTLGEKEIFTFPPGIQPWESVTVIVVSGSYQLMTDGIIQTL
jgi:hypothetical protein